MSKRFKFVLLQTVDGDASRSALHDRLARTRGQNYNAA
jgi:hypothetical protein